MILGRLRRYGIHRLDRVQQRYRDFIFAEPLNIDTKGYVHLPQGPGLGIELDEEKMARYEQADTRRLI